MAPDGAVGGGEVEDWLPRFEGHREKAAEMSQQRNTGWVVPSRSRITENGFVERLGESSNPAGVGSN
jgi:hypothetical protein